MRIDQSLCTCAAPAAAHYTVSNFFAALQPGDKPAVLMVHFGTTHEDTRALTINAINAKATEVFAPFEVREAYTSRIIIRRLKERGITKLNPQEALLKLHADGYTHLLVQSTHIIEGVEMESLRRNVEAEAHRFKDIRVGNPLLYDRHDYELVTDALIATPLSAVCGANILVGHGTYTPATAAYTMVEHLLRVKGRADFLMGTIEGYPSFDDLLSLLNRTEYTHVTLIPFMFVAGDHAKNDIAGEWKQQLEDAGYIVDVHLHGLGEIPAIQDVFIAHARFAAHYQARTILEKKKEYETSDKV